MWNTFTCYRLLYFCTRKFIVVEKLFFWQLIFQQHSVAISGFFSVEVCLQRFCVSMVSNPYLTDTLGISIQLWNGSNRFLFSFPASIADFTPLTFWHSNYCWKLSPEMPHGKKNKEQANPLHYHEGMLLDLGVC